MNGPHIYLVGAYGTGDMTTSMGRFTELLRAHLTSRGLGVDVLKPRAILGASKLVPRKLRPLAGLVDKLVLFPRELRRASRRARAAGTPYIFHICDQAYANYTGPLRDVPHLVTCHDVMGIEAALGRSPYMTFGWNTRLYQKMLLRGLNRAQRVVCVSETTRLALKAVSTIPDSRIRTILIGPNHPYSPMPEAEALERVGRLLGGASGQPYILHVGANIWYKNRAGALRIFARLRELRAADDLRLVMVGRSFTPEMKAIVEEESLSGLVIPQVNIDSEDLRALYSRAKAMIFPSLCEGFGWPILEAQSCGCPVLTTNRPPMTEVGGTAALYFDPADPAEAARTIAAGWGELPALSASGPANATRFNTEHMMDEYVQTYRELAGA